MISSSDMVFRDREAVLRAVKAQLQPHYSAKRISKDEFVMLCKACLQWVLDAPHASDAWTPAGVTRHVEARVEALLGGEGAVTLHQQQQQQQQRSTTPLKGTIEAHRAALASIRGRMVRVLGQADIPPNGAFDDDLSMSAQVAPTVAPAGPRRGSGASSSALSVEEVTEDHRLSAPPSALSPPFRPRRSPSATPVAATTPRTARVGGAAGIPTHVASIVHVPAATLSPPRPPAAAPQPPQQQHDARAAAAQEVQRFILHQLEVLELRESSARQAVELDETRAWQSSVAMPFVTRAAALMIGAATRAAAAAAVVPTRQRSPPPPPLPNPSPPSHSAAPTPGTSDLSSAPHRQQQQHNPRTSAALDALRGASVRQPPPAAASAQVTAVSDSMITRAAADDPEVQELYAQLQAKQRALRAAMLNGSAAHAVGGGNSSNKASTPEQQPRSREGGPHQAPPQVAAAAAADEGVDHDYAARNFQQSPTATRWRSPKQPTHMSPSRPAVVVHPQQQRRTMSPRGHLLSTSSPRGGAAGHLTPSRRGAVPVGRPTRPEVVDFMRQVLQPYYNEGLLPQSAFVAIVKSVSTDFFGPGHDWRSGTPAADRTWQSYLEDRLHHCVARLEHRHTGV